MMHDKDTMTEPPNQNSDSQKLTRREFLKAGLAAMKFGIPIGVIFYIVDRTRKYQMFSSALEKFNITNLPTQATIPSLSAPQNGRNQGDVNSLNPTATEFSQEITETPYVVPSPEPSPTTAVVRTVDQFILGDGQADHINMADFKRNIMMFIVANNSLVIPSPRAAPHAYSPEAEQAGVFEFYNLTTMSYIATGDGDATNTWIHSGILDDGTHLFGGYIERSIRVDPWGNTKTVAQTIEFIENELIGAKVYLIQEKFTGLLPLTPPTSFNLDNFTRVNILELTVTSAARVSNEAMDDYNVNVNRTATWLKGKPSGIWQSGWESFDARSNWTIKTCLGTAKDEPGAFDLTRNRLILSLKPTKGLRDPVFDPREPLAASSGY